MNRCINGYMAMWSTEHSSISCIHYKSALKTVANWFKSAAWGGRAVEGGQCLFNLIFHTFIEQVLSMCPLFTELHSWSFGKIHRNKECVYQRDQMNTKKCA